MNREQLTEWLPKWATTLRLLPGFIDAPQEQVAAELKRILALRDTGKQSDFYAVEFGRQAMQKVAAYVAAQDGAPQPDATFEDKPLAVEVTPPQPGDFAFSIWPDGRGEWQRDGVRFSFAVKDAHDPALAFEVMFEFIAYIQANGAIRVNGAGATTAAPGREVWANDGKQFFAVGERGRMEIDRMQATGRESVDLFQPGAQYKIITVNAAFRQGEHYAVIREKTGVDPQTLVGTHTFDPPITIEFEIGNKTTSHGNHYINFVNVVDVPKAKPVPF